MKKPHPPPAEARQLSRNETHDLSMIIKDRAKVLRAHADEQAAACMADFERKLAAVYSWDQDTVWKAAAAKAFKVVEQAQAELAAQCEKLGIPKAFAPAIAVSWRERGENALAGRRAELRRVAKTSIEAMQKAAITKIEKQALDLRTQVVAMAVLSSEARLFLDSLAPVQDAMRALDFGEMERRLEQEQRQRVADRRSYGAEWGGG